PPAPRAVRRAVARARAAREPGASRRARGTRTGEAQGRRRRLRRSALARPAALVLPLGELEVVPRHAPVLGAWVAQQERRMKRRDQHRVAERMHASTELADRLLGAQQRLRRDGAEREYYLGLDGGELRVEERTARGELVALRISIGRRT